MFRTVCFSKIEHINVFIYKLINMKLKNKILYLSPIVSFKKLYGVGGGDFSWWWL